MKVHGNSAVSRDIATMPHPYTNLKAHQSKGPLIVTHGRGVKVYEEQGKQYIEGLTGLRCVSLGFTRLNIGSTRRASLRTTVAGSFVVGDGVTELKASTLFSGSTTPLKRQL